MSTKKTSYVDSYVSSYVSSNVTQQGNSTSYVSELQIISLLESYGFTIKGKYIHKKSTSNRLEVCGNLNENSIYFHATNNIFPFEAGVTYSFKKLLKGFNTSIVSNEELERIAKKRTQEKLQEKPKVKISFDEYISTTNEAHNFNLQNLLDSFHKNSNNSLISIPAIWENENNVRGKWGKTYFPLLDEKDKFITAQIIKYKLNLKRDRDTNIYFLTTNGNIGLYRRNLYDETLNTIIVESPKLAELGAALLPKFNWMATFGKEKLGVLDLSFLDNQKTFVLPDFDAYNEWKEIAVNKWNFRVIDIFQKEIEKLSIQEQKEYSDFADLILPYLQCKSNKIEIEILYKIYSSLINLLIDDEDLLQENNPEVESYNSELGFKEKKRKNIKFVSSIPKDFCENTKGLYKKSSEGGYSIKTEYFEVFTDDFEIISSSFNICKEQTQEDFLLNLERCFRVLRYLNESTYLALFDVVLSHIQIKGNYFFNQSYIRDVMVKEWEQIDALYIDDLIKKRNYNYLGGAEFNNYEFLAELRKAKKLYKIHSQLKAIREVVNSGIDKIKFIDKKELGLTKEVGNEYIFNLINRFNLLSIGSTDKRIIEVVKTLAMFNITIYKGYYYFYNEKISVNEAMKRSGINRVTLGNLLKFQRNSSTIRNVLVEIDYLIDNYNSFGFNRIEVKGKFFNSVFPIFESEKKQVNSITTNEAFIDDLDLSNSILNCDIEEAYNRGMDFYISWYLYQYKIDDEEIRQYLKYYKYDLFHKNWNPMELMSA